MAAQIKIRTGLLTLDCSVAAFAALCQPPLVTRKLSQQQLNQVVSGRMDLEEKDVAEFLSVIDTMNYLQDTITPKLPINWSDPLLVRDILVQAHANRIEREDPTIPRLCFIRLSRLNYFAGMRSNGSVRETINLNDAAAFIESALADKCIRKLAALHVNAHTEILTAPRRKSQVTRSLEELGFEPAVVGGLDEHTETAA